MKEYLEKMVSGRDLSRSEAHEAMNRIMSGGATPAQIGAFLVALRMKGESIDEVTGCVEGMRDASEKVALEGDIAIDTCGTGGDAKGTFNISTATAFVVAGAGVKVAKHGNRAASGTTGSADVLAELGAEVSLPPKAVAECIRQTNFGFMFAPRYHPAMKHAIGPRRELGLRTVFNILGPLTNPAGVRRQVIGVGSPEIAQLVATVLGRLGAERALVFHSRDGMDEISSAAPTTIYEINEGELRQYELDPASLEIHPETMDSLRVASAAESAARIRSVLSGEKCAGRNVVALNAAAALVAAGTSDDLASAIGPAYESIDSGSAAQCMERFVELSRQLSSE